MGLNSKTDRGNARDRIPPTFGRLDRIRTAFSGYLFLVLFLLMPGWLEACTVGCAMGNATQDRRPLAWKNRDGGKSRLRHFVMYKTGRDPAPAVGLRSKPRGREPSTYSFLGIGPDLDSPKMGLNSAGLALANATIEEFKTEGWKYSNHQQFKNYILGECSTIAEVREAIIAVTGGNAHYWPTPISLSSSFCDAKGGACTWELCGDVYYEYDPTNDNRLRQLPWQFVVRDNDSQMQTGHTDNPRRAGARYRKAVVKMRNSAAAGGITMADMFNIVSRSGSPGFENPRDISNENTIAVMVAHGVNAGEDTRIATMWVALGNPDYTCFVPCWVALENDISPRASSNDPDSTLSGASEKLYNSKEGKEYDRYINRLIAPVETNIIEAVTAARAQWFEKGFDLEQSRRIHHEACETAWRTMNAICQGTARNRNDTPTLTKIETSSNGLCVDFRCSVSDTDGHITEYSWDFGDGNYSPSASPVHRYFKGGTYLVRCRVTDNEGSRNSKWTYLTVK